MRSFSENAGFVNYKFETTKHFTMFRETCVSVNGALTLMFHDCKGLAALHRLPSSQVHCHFVLSFLKMLEK